MVFLIRLIISLFEKNKIIKMLWMPPRKILNSHLLGLTLGLIAIILLFCFNYSPLFDKLPWYTSVLYGILFIAGTFLGGAFVILLAIFLVLFIWLSQEPARHWEALFIISQWYFIAYWFGAIFAILYNDLVFLLMYVFKNDSIKIIFAFDTEKKFNIIKSPIETEELAMLDVIKPMMYYTQQIYRFNTNETDNQTNRANIHKYIVKVTTFITDTYNAEAITNNDKNNLIEILQSILIQSDDIKLLMDELDSRLSSGNQEMIVNLITALETQIEPIVEKYLVLKKNKFFNYKPATIPEHPYTIIFMANPKLLEPKIALSKKSIFSPDLINKNIYVYLYAVRNAIYSLASNEVVGRPEIWSRIRIIAVFDETLVQKPGNQAALLQPYPGDVTIDDAYVTNMITPFDDTWDKFKQIVEKEYNKDNCGFVYENAYNTDSKTSSCDTDLATYLDDTDILFVMSADLRYLRSTAMASYFDTTFPPKPHSREFYKLNFDPCTSKRFQNESSEYESEIKFPYCVDSDGNILDQNAIYEYYAELPGCVALNIFGANFKTYIHEFAHAMSCPSTGYITDEYFDDMIKEHDAPASPPQNKTIFCINRIDRIQPSDARPVIPVHKVFAKYNCVYYYSDRNHPSTNEHWIGYFPDRKSHLTHCIMDRLSRFYCFDELIHDFMYDRLIVKLNRKHRPGGTAP
ncbi:hypothetical protein JW960_09400 [candidate division KSB1 bacterium]|nr:hypothetical protein [candidate division KSB1 bacterium]